MCLSVCASVSVSCNHQIIITTLLISLPHSPGPLSATSQFITGEAVQSQGLGGALSSSLLLHYLQGRGQPWRLPHLQALQVQHLRLLYGLQVGGWSMRFIGERRVLRAFQVRQRYIQISRLESDSSRIFPSERDIFGKAFWKS